MHWRQQQLAAYEKSCTIKQDADLILYIKQNSVSECVAIGDVEYFNQYIKFVEGPSNFGIFIQNTFFHWHTLADQINRFLKEKILPQGIVYLSINKYLAHPTRHVPVLSDDYDQAIVEFVQQHVQARVVDHSFDPNDQGQKFNFAHPLTRFYLQKHDN